MENAYEQEYDIMQQEADEWKAKYLEAKQTLDNIEKLLKPKQDYSPAKRTALAYKQASLQAREAAKAAEAASVAATHMASVADKKEIEEIDGDEEESESEEDEKESEEDEEESEVYEGQMDVEENQALAPPPKTIVVEEQTLVPPAPPPPPAPATPSPAPATPSPAPAPADAVTNLELFQNLPSFFSGAFRVGQTVLAKYNTGKGDEIFTAKVVKLPQSGVKVQFDVDNSYYVYPHEIVTSHLRYVSDTYNSFAKRQKTR